MITAVRLISVAGKVRGSLYLQGSYVDSDNTTRTLIDKGRRVVTGMLQPEQIPQGYRIDANSHKEIEISDSESGKAVLNWLKNHPMVFTPGYKNPNITVKPMFELFIQSERIATDFRNIQEKLIVVDIVRKMSIEEMQDLCFALGGDPRNTSNEGVYIDLIGTSLNGRAVSKPIETLNFLKLKRSESVAMVYAQKAIRYGLAVKDTGVYKINNRTLGANAEQLASAFRADADLFDGYIKPEIDKLDKSGIVAGEHLFDPMVIPEDLRDLIPAIVEKGTEVKSLATKVQ
jgi:hypothetical protein